MVLLVASASVYASSTDAQLKKTQNELNRVQDLLNDVNKSTKENEMKQGAVVKEISSLETQITTLEKQIDSIDESTKKTEGQIANKEVELKIAENTILQKKDVLDSRLRVMYKTGSIGYLQVLLGADDFEDLLTRADAVKKIFIHDTNLIEEHIKQRNLVEEAKIQLEEYKAELIAFRAEKEAAQKTMGSKKNDLSVQKKKLLEDHRVLEQQEDRLLADANKIKSIIANLKLSEKYVGGVMTWPTPGYNTITSPFGNRMHPILKKMKLHTGIDIGTPSNSNVIAAQGGTIIHSDWLGGYGKVIMIDHGGGVVTLYAHNNSLLAKVGDAVAKGQPIAKSGSTGQSTGPHVHFEVRINGDYVDPMTYVTKQ